MENYFDEPFLTPEELEVFEVDCAPRPFSFEPDPEDNIPY